MGTRFIVTLLGRNEFLHKVSCTLGLPEYGMQLLKRFKWGPGFYQLNQEVLDNYAACKTSADVIEAQSKWMEKLQQEDAQRYNTGRLRQSPDDD